MKLRIGTRRSKLALWQAHHVQNLLQKVGFESEIVEIESFGDQVQDLPLHKLGEKGVFTKALDEALFANQIDLAVHSLKDVPTELEEGLSLASVLERANPFDTLVKPLSPNPSSNILATGSIRRKAFWLNKFPDFECVDLRGNVPTRLNKVDSNGWYGAIFAYAGLERLDLDTRISEVLDWMLPAPSQGAIGVICRSKDASKSCFEILDHKETRICVEIERAFLNRLDAGCSSPVGAYARVLGSEIHFLGAVLSVDGKERLDIERKISAEAATTKLGRDFAEELINLGAAKLLAKS